MTQTKRLSLLWLTVLVVLLVVTGCARKVPQEVTDLNRALGDAKDACATVYAADSLAGVQGDVDGVNRLADDKKYRKARKQAEGLMSGVSSLEAEAESGRAKAKQAADEKLAEAEKTLAAAGEDPDARTFAAGPYASAADKLAEAKSAAADPCKYPQAAKLAEEANDLARRARNAAIAEKKRRDEEAARLAEEQRRKEEEARRRAEEEARRNARPPVYVVEKGDYLWKISGMEKVYQAPKYWPLIFDSNRGQIQDPDLIYPGQSLTIPREMAEGEMMDKLRILWSKAAREGEL